MRERNLLLLLLLLLLKEEEGNAHSGGKWKVYLQKISSNAY